MGQIQGKILNIFYCKEFNPLVSRKQATKNLGIQSSEYGSTVKIIFRKAGVNNSLVSPVVLVITSIYLFMVGH